MMYKIVWRATVVLAVATAVEIVLAPWGPLTQATWRIVGKIERRKAHVGD